MALGLALWAALLGGALAAPSPPHNAHRLGLDNGLARTPQMGWNSWNKFGCGVSEALVVETAEAMKSTGLAAAGYVYVNMDDCWQVGRADNGTGAIVADPKAFPGGIKALAGTVHSLGLKFGLYSDAGYRTCAGRPGSLGFEKIDALTYASWDVDYLKYDNCNTNTTSPIERYTRMHDALNATGRPILFSMCEWGFENPATWAAPVGNSWRTTGDIAATYDRMTINVDRNDLWAEYAGPGGWNDPDMLEVGNGEMVGAKARSHFGIWCIVKAPLLLGNDLRSIDKETLALVTHDEAIAINQDPLGAQAKLVRRVFEPGHVPPAKCEDKNQNCASWAAKGECKRNPAYMWDFCKKSCDRCDPDGLQTWAGPLSGGRIVVALWNRSNQTAKVTADWPDVGLKRWRAAAVRDVWERKDVGLHIGSFSATVEPYDALLYVLTPKPWLAPEQQEPGSRPERRRA